MRKFYAFLLAVLMVVGLSAAVHADATTTAQTYGGYQVEHVVEVVPFSGTTVTGVAECPDASWAVTGGGHALESGVTGSQVFGSSATTTADGVGSWTVAMTKSASSPATNLHVRVICAKLG